MLQAEMTQDFMRTEGENSVDIVFMKQTDVFLNVANFNNV